MPSDQNTIIFYIAVVAAIVLAIVGVLYLGGIAIATGSHGKRAVACFVAAVVAAGIAYATRPQAGAIR